MKDNLTRASTVVPFISLLLTLLALMLNFASHARQWPASFKRVTGLVVVFLSLLTIAGCIAWLQSKHLPVTRWPGTGLVGAAIVGVGLCIAGLMRVVRAPLDKDTEPLRAIADEMVSQLSRADRSPFGGSEFVEVTATETTGRGSSAPLVARLTRERAPVVVVSGPAGAGKSTALREVALRVCRRARSKRSPSLLAVYVDLSTLAHGDGVPTSEVIRDHVRKVVAKDDLVMGAKLDACLQGDADRARWIFLFDSLDELAITWPTDATAERMEQFFDAVHRFLRPGGGRFRAVITTRDEPLPPPGYPVLTVEPLSRRQQRRFMRAAGLRSKTQHRLLRQLRHAADDAVAAPLPLRLWCEDLVLSLSHGGDVAVPGTLYEVVDATVNARLQRAPDARLRANEISAIAEQIAFCMATEVELGSGPSRSALIAALIRHGLDNPAAAEAAMRSLTELELAAADRPHTFAFAHRSFQDFFVTKWLLSGHDRPELKVVLTDQRWREAAITALRAGPDQLRGRLVSVATRIVGEETSQHLTLVPDVAEYLALDPSAPLPVLPPVSGATATWPGRLSHVLKVLAAGLADQPALVPDAIRASTGRLVVTAFLRGNRSDQKTALELVPLLNSTLAIWACERAVNSESQLLLETAVKVSHQEPTLLGSMRIRSRLLLVAGIMRSPELFRHLLRARTPGRADGTLPSLVHDLTLILRVVAAFIVGSALFFMTKSVVNQPSVATVLWWVSITVVALSFLALSLVPEQIVIERVHFLVNAFVIVVAAVMAMIGLFEALGSMRTLFTDFGGSVLGLLWAYLLTWPASMIGYLVADPPVRRRDWRWPQWFAGRILVNELRAHIPELSGSWVLRRVLAVVTSLGFLLPLAFVVTIRVLPAPDQQAPEAVQSRWSLTVLGVIIGVVGVVALVRAALRRHNIRVQIRRGITDGMTNDTLLALLGNTASQSETGLLLTKLRQAPPDTLHSCVTALTDLAQALEHVSRMVPADTKSRIPRGVWDAGLQYSQTSFREWLEDYDARHKGMLRWLASHHGDTIAHLLDRAAAIPSHQTVRSPRPMAPNKAGRSLFR